MNRAPAYRAVPIAKVHDGSRTVHRPAGFDRPVRTVKRSAACAGTSITYQTGFFVGGLIGHSQENRSLSKQELWHGQVNVESSPSTEHGQVRRISATRRR